MQIPQNIVTLGADIEEFVVHNDKIIPVCGLIGGTKDTPIETPNGAVQEDNVTVEYNPRPASSEDEFVHNVLAARQDARDILSKLGLTTIAQSSHIFKPADLVACGSAAMTFGCVPDYSVHGDTGQYSPPPDPFTGLRTAGGHIHFGSGINEELSHNIIKWADVLLGVPSVILDPDKQRRDMYGKAGAHRLKHKDVDTYDGVEYRTLGNWWVSDEKLIRWVWRCSQRAYTNAVNKVVVPEFYTSLINEVNPCLSYQTAYVERHNLEMP